MHRKPSPAMIAADARRIEIADTAVRAALSVALVGCPEDCPMGHWLEHKAAPEARQAYARALENRRNVEDTAIARGTHYRGTFGMVYPIRWK